MNENTDSESKESGDYEDDFEKDLEWLINEKEKSDASIIEVHILPTAFVIDYLNSVLCNFWRLLPIISHLSVTQFFKCSSAFGQFGQVQLYTSF